MAVFVTGALALLLVVVVTRTAGWLDRKQCEHNHGYGNAHAREVCADGSAVRDATSDRLLAAADSAAQRNGGEAKHVEVVETTRGKAADLTGHGNQNQDEDVWVVQVSGDHYRCDVCSHPYGAQTPRGDYITIVLRASDFESTDGGLGPTATDLAVLGQVSVLRG